MSPAEQYLYAFIHLLKHEPNLFTKTDTDRKNLGKLCDSLDDRDDSPDQLSDAIIVWCKENKENPKILQALRKKRKSLFPQSSQNRAPGSNEGKVKTPDYELNKQTLQNAIQQSSSSSDSKSSNSG